MPTIFLTISFYVFTSHDSAVVVVVAPNVVVTQLNFYHFTNNEHNNETTAVYKTQQHLTTSERKQQQISVDARMQDSSFLFYCCNLDKLMDGQEEASMVIDVVSILIFHL